MGEALMRHRVRRRLPKFTYTGSYMVIDDGHGDWRIRFLSSGTLTFLTTLPKGIDVFLVGGGGGGSWYTNTISWEMKAGGGSGYTKTVKGVSVAKGTGYGITIGAGGAAGGSSGAVGAVGGNTTAFGQTAYGGNRSSSGSTDNSYKARAGYTRVPDYEPSSHGWAYGGYGGSGGGIANGSLPAQATNGANGGNNGAGDGAVGHGQGTTTREFGESGGTLYANGGGSGSYVIPNSGNGGNYSGAGSSGIVVIRNHRE